MYPADLPAEINALLVSAYPLLLLIANDLPHRSLVSVSRLISQPPLNVPTTFSGFPFPEFLYAS